MVLFSVHFLICKNAERFTPERAATPNGELCDPALIALVRSRAVVTIRGPRAAWAVSVQASRERRSQWYAPLGAQRSQTGHNGTSTTFTDESGNQRVQTLDGPGRTWVTVTTDTYDATTT